MEPRGHKVKPQGSRKYKKSATWTPRDSKWSPWCHIGTPRSPKMQNTHKKLTRIAKKHTRRCPEVPNKEEKPYTHKQPTNQRNKEGHKEKQTNEQTHTRTRASNCEHKHKLPRPGARRRRRRSAAHLRAGVLGDIPIRVS